MHCLSVAQGMVTMVTKVSNMLKTVKTVEDEADDEVSLGIYPLHPYDS